MRRLALLLLLPALPAFADDAVVGTGTPASCTEAAFDAALGALVPGANAPGGTVTFNCGPGPVTIALTTQKAIGFGYGIGIDGGGRVTLDAGGRTRHFVVSGADSRIEIANLTLTGGRADQGGALYLDSDTATALRNVTLVDNVATGGGGAIFSQARGALSVDASEVRSNEAPGGGAFALNGPLTVTNTRFALNVADTEGGALQLYNAAVTIQGSRLDFNGAHDGGALLQRGGTLAITDTVFEQNQATALGGAVHVATNAVATLTRVTARGNTAGASGGALFQYNDDAAPFASLKVLGGSYEDNSANDGGAIACFNRGQRNEALDPCPWVDAVFARNVASARGGAVLVAGHGRAIGATFRANRARDGGAVWAQQALGLARTLFDSNGATMSGGAVLTESALFGVDEGCRFFGNVATFGGAIRVNGGLGYVNSSLLEQNDGRFIGGGLLVSSDEDYGQALILVAHTTFRNNVASNGRGGDVAVVNGDNLPAEVQVSYSTLVDSVASAEGASLYSAAGAKLTSRANIVFPLAGTACAASGGGTIVSEGANVSRISNCGFAGADDVSFAARSALMLMPFANYGGPTSGYLPMPGSPVLDRALCNQPFEAYDQRKLPRPADGDGDGFALCDAGALERQAVEEPPSALPFRNGFED